MIWKAHVIIFATVRIPRQQPHRDTDNVKTLGKWFNVLQQKLQLYSYSKFNIYKNYSRQMHLHKPTISF